MADKQNFLKVSDISHLLGVGRTKAYAIIKQLNQELEKKGYLVESGRTSAKYFRERYGIND